MSQKIIWIGPIVKTEDLNSSKAISPAANVWQLGFVNGLIENDYKVISVSYMPLPSWPNGKLWCGKHQTINDKKNFKQYSIPYLNIKGIREFWMALAILKILIFKIPKKKYLLFTYNPLKRHCLTATLYKKLFNKNTWISIIADDLVKNKPDYNLFLSYDYYKRFQSDKKLFLDGGIPLRNLVSQKNENPKKSLVYAGSLSKWTGIKDFVNLFSLVDSKEFILNIYGKGDVEELQKVIAKTGSKNIILHGFVSDDILESACNEAYAFVNPRAKDIVNSENNFPSKLLHYLSFQKPIISTSLKGVGPIYDEFLLYFSNQEDLKNVMNRIIDSEYYIENKKNISSFIKYNSWKDRTKNILSKIN